MVKAISKYRDTTLSRTKPCMTGRSQKQYPGSRRQFLWAGAMTLCISGCAISGKPYEPPADVPLQDPLPGQALVYLLRAPHDSIRIEVLVNGAKVATLPASTYTAISLMPGKHEVSARRDSMLGVNQEVAPPVSLAVQPGQRRFLQIAGTMARVIEMAGITPIQSTGVANASRAWKEISGEDAQGLMSIARPVVPEKGAL
jgi:hypothetical protein